jgi:hypothetical protein
LGLPVTCVGIPVLLGGTAKKNAAKKKLQISPITLRTPMSSKTINGLSLKVTF